MKRLRIFLLPLMAVFEALLMLAALFVAGVNIERAISMVEWSKRLPDLEWYFEKGKS